MLPLSPGSQEKLAAVPASYEQERAKACADSRQECQAHQQDMQAVHPDVPLDQTTQAIEKEKPSLPPAAHQYLVKKCHGNERLLGFARVEALKLEPDILNDPITAEMFLDDCIAEAEIAAKTETENQKLETIVTNEQGLEEQRTIVKGLRNDIAVAAKGKIGREQIQFAQQFLEQKFSEVNLPEEQQEELRAWLGGIAATLNEMTALVKPEETQAFNDIIASTTFDLTGETDAVVFSNLMTQVSDSDQFSPETRAAIAQKLGIVQLHDKVDTGGDINDIFSKGYGVETYLDEDGTVKTRQVHLNKKERISIGRGQEIGLDETGGRAIWVQTQVGKFQASIPERATDHDMGNIIRTIQMRASLHGMNMAEVFYPDAEVFERGGGLIKIRTEDYTITEKLRSIIIGHEALDGNKLFTTADLAKVPYLMQFHSRHGDYVTGDVDPTQMREDYRAQGIIDKDGQVDWVRFEELVMNNRAHTYTAPQNFKNTVREATES